LTFIFIVLSKEVCNTQEINGASLHLSLSRNCQ